MIFFLKRKNNYKTTLSTKRKEKSTMLLIKYRVLKLGMDKKTERTEPIQTKP